MKSKFDRIGNLKQSAFYSVVFLGALVYQPNWVLNNFWLNADFYDSLPFVFPYFLFLLIYSIFASGLTWIGVQLIKRYL